MDRIAPTRRPAGPARGFQSWRTLLFLHWEVPAAAVQALLPRGLDVDTFEGRAYVGLVPFTMRGVRPRGLPAVGAISDFHETNVRTYVHLDGEAPGVWFFSLDAAKAIPVRIARRFWRLPYHRADMALEEDGDVVRYASARRRPGPTPADLRVAWRRGEAIGHAQPGTFEHFLAERYLLYADWGDRGLYVGQVHHTSYPLQRAEVLELDESLVAAAGLARTGEPHVLASPGVDVEVFDLKPV